VYRQLFELFKAIQQQSTQPGFASFLLDHVVQFTGADRGFIVMRDEADDYKEAYQVHFEKASRSEAKHAFSRSLVREAIKTQTVLLSKDLSQDLRFEKIASVASFGPASVLVVPLKCNREVNAVIYLEKADQPFEQEHLEFVRELAEIGGLTLSLALEREALRTYKKLREIQIMERYDFGPIITKHPRMLKLLEMVGRVADSDATVLIRGETGTGKELIAQALYQNSPRRQRPFVTLHCGALPETLLESELFGHKRGAYTGAVSDRAGRVSLAHGGTLFIDEVAEIPLTTQAKLLRFFQFGEFQRIGSDRTEKVDVRLIAATHADLGKMVEEGRFRADLYYRLNVVELQIPPLRERRSDVLPLLDSFLKRHWPPRKGMPRLTPVALDRLLQHPFPGNVRELEHIVERMCLLAGNESLDVDLFPADLHPKHAKNNPEKVPNPYPTSVDFVAFTNEELKRARSEVSQTATAQVEQVFLAGLLERFGNDVKKAAAHAGMQRTYLYKLIAKHQSI